MKRTMFIISIVTAIFSSCSLLSHKGSNNVDNNYGKMAKKESLVPVHPGIPSKVPFWNKYSKRFIYAPAFDFKEIANASNYKFEILCLSDSSRYEFMSKHPYAPLSPVWGKMPVGYFNIKVFGISSNGNKLGLSGKGHYYRAAYFNGPYHRPVIPYDSSAMIALDSLLHQSYVTYWLLHKTPDPSYENYQYPAKIYSALIVGAVTYAKLNPHTENARRAIDIATIVADYLLQIRFPKGFVYYNFPPTYYGKWISTRDTINLPYIRLNNSMPIYGRRAGNAFLDLYDWTGDRKYFVAAKQIASTYLKTQLKNGSWYLYVNPETGDPTSKNIAIPIEIVNYLDRLKEEYHVKGLSQPINKAMKWIMNNPVKTFDWQGQFEDVGARAPYSNLSREQACDLAVYLFKNKSKDNESMKLAEDLVRFSEDQFVIWESPRELIFGKAKGRRSEDWITPCVQEQYLYWMPVTRSAGIMIETYWYAYQATNKKIYLAKAESIANALTLVQKELDGNYSAYFTPYPMDGWLNGIVYPAKVMLLLSKGLGK